MRASILVAALVALSSSANAVSLVQTGSPGFYNNSIGTALNLTNGGNTATAYFPTTNDSMVSFPVAPDLSAASTILGNWLSDPLHLNGSWTSSPIAVPNQWAINTEVAVMYRFDTVSATNVVARFGVDNGIFVWLDGSYLFGARAGGSFNLGEYSVNVGDLSAGTHFLQLLLEDHGTTNGYAVDITADTFVPGVPEPATITLLGLGLSGIAWRKPKR